MDTCHIHLQFRKIFVDATTGNDSTGTGSVNLPVKSITHALGMADAGMMILVQPGIYDQANGEVFELVLPGGVALVGMDWETCIIRGHGTGTYNAAFLFGGHGASFRKFTMEMGDPIEGGWHIAIRVKYDNQLVDSIRVLERASSSVLRTSGSDNTVVQNCYFAVDDGYQWDRAFELLGAEHEVVLRNCTISGFSQGIFINGLHSPLIEGCFITGNNVGLSMWYELPSHNPSPDLGGGARGSIGGNTFTGNTECGLVNPTSNAIYAKFNTWDNDPPIEGADYCIEGTGSVITE
jgi:hypothetical protein